MDLEGPALEALKYRAKRQLRGRMRALRNAIPPAALAVRSHAIVERLLGLPEVTRAHAVALFHPMEAEVDLRALDAALRARGTGVFYPLIRSDPGREESTPEFARVGALGELAETGRGFLEPSASAVLAHGGEIDVIVVPALGVSEHGHRLGYGSGFYDEILPRFRPPARAVVVAFDFQLLAELPTTEGDVACDIVVTDARLLLP